MCSVPKVVEKGSSATEIIPICSDYRYGKCQKGDKCNYAHPAKCLDYCRYGRDGCSGGYRKCKLLHPVLCRSSLRYNQCFDESCTLAHLRGTNRKRESFPTRNHQSSNGGPRNVQAQYRGTRYSPIDSRNLGFLNYKQTRRSQTNYSGYPNDSYRANQNASGFYLNQNEYPDISVNQENNQGVSPPQVTQNHQVPNTPDPSIFLEMVQQLKSMREAQNTFQQELSTLKSMIPPPMHQSQMPQNPYYQGQSQYNPGQARAM